ncbi:MAG: hypothetical protein ACJA01_004379 [Saprospiraceae bacterium]|jgi:hypothetical protein
MVLHGASFRQSPQLMHLGNKFDALATGGQQIYEIKSYWATRKNKKNLIKSTKIRG